MLAEVHETEIPVQVQEPNGWEPATFELSCPSGHRWGSTGYFHHTTYTMAPNQPTCPRHDCGRLNDFTLVYYGPKRLSVVEARPR
jgi:hypothetical protein